MIGALWSRSSGAENLKRDPLDVLPATSKSKRQPNPRAAPIIVDALPGPG
jgi:hypothetical protein